MRLYRARNTLNIGQTIDMLIFKGQLFFVDSYLDLPNNPKNQQETISDWEELELKNNYGTIQIVKKI
jgi:hypothetical protein